MNQQKQNILIVETKDGAKYQGIFISKDIQKQIITLSNVKKTFQGKEETLNLIEIAKDSIASIKRILLTKVNWLIWKRPMINLKMISLTI